jgi:F-type H+-transporting ATPase subunit b
VKLHPLPPLAGEGLSRPGGVSMIGKLSATGLAFALAAPAFAAEAGEAGANNPFAGNIGNALWTLVVFFVVVVVLGKFAWGPLLGALQRREEFIRQSLETAKREREEAEARLKEYVDKLNAARAEATAIVEEGRRDAEATRRRIEAEAHAETEKMVARGRREIEIATESAVKEIYQTVARLSTEAAARILGREISPADHERLIAQSIEQLGQTPRPDGSGKAAGRAEA